jgi:hypothetical protein
MHRLDKRVMRYAHSVTCHLIYIFFFISTIPVWSHGQTEDHDPSPWLEQESVVKLPIKPSSEYYRVEIITRDGAGQKTPAFVAVKYADSWQWLPLEQPFLPNPRSLAQRSFRPQWKTKYPIHSDGRVVVKLPKGQFKLYAGKGLEFTPVKQTFQVGEKGVVTVDVTLKRYIDMPAKGWWSGDTHVHAQRIGAKDNRELLLAAQAEDIYVSSLLLMGDSEFLHFPQYAPGSAGTVSEGNYWLVPGQEEPRTSELGHAIILNTQRLYRNTSDYYRYDKVFEQARADQALTGIAHYFNDKFLSRNAGALLFAENKLDFVELLDNTGMFKPEHYYEALNMGSRLSLTAGSDFPWGAHIGDNRTYAFLPPGDTLTPAKWYAAVKAGRTFVTQGPLLSFSINGKPVGSDLYLHKGEPLAISVRAEGYPGIGSPKTVRLISMGETLKQIETEKRDVGVLEFSFRFIPQKSQWFVVTAEAYNGAVAHSSPIYVHLDGVPPIASEDLRLTLYREYSARIERLREATFVPIEQRQAFIEWLNRVQSIYSNRISQLELKLNSESRSRVNR